MRLEQRSGQWETQQSATSPRPWLARKDHPKNQTAMPAIMRAKPA